MKDYSGILIASDWDGTLFYDGKVNERDIKAIKEFQACGGLFTLCSGRPYQYMTTLFDKVHPNTYAITLNGAKIIHPDSREILYEGYLDYRIQEMLDRVFLAERLFNTLTVYFNGDVSPSVTYTPEEYLVNRDRFVKEKIHKVIMVTDEENKSLRAKAMLECSGYDGYIFVRSWDVSLEILKEENGKGYAINRVREKEGCHTTIAVGDYENDIQMLKMADIGYAVGNATEAARAAADRITLPAFKGAIAEIIYSL